MEEEEEEEEVPSYMAKAKKTGGIGGLGLSKKNSLGGGSNMAAAGSSNGFGASKTGGSFYGGGGGKMATKVGKIVDPYGYDDEDDYDEEEQNDYYGGGSMAKPQPKAAPQKGSSGGTGKKDIVPKRFGLNYDPPTIILEYQINGKLYHHKMKILKLKPETKNEDALDYLKKKHFQYFISNKIDTDQIINLLDKLKTRLKSKLIGSGTSKTKQLSSYMDKKKSSIQQQVVSKPRQQAAYDYDQEVDYDEEGDYYGEGGEEEYDDDKYGSEGDYYGEEDGYDQQQYQDMNLNKLSTQELQKHKDKMEVGFKRNSLRPGQPGYQYEVNQEFNPEESNDWDD